MNGTMMKFIVSMAVGTAAGIIALAGVILAIGTAF